MEYCSRNRTMVSIFCLTYNHVEFIRDALEGFLCQNIKYKYNVFVFDDASTDGTSNIVREYAEKYPEIFRIYISPQNTYKKLYRRELLAKLYDKYLDGKYIAWCEGDDYWIDSSKLQIQVDYLETHPQCAMTAHSAIWQDYRTKEKYKYEPYSESRILTPEEVIMQYKGNLPTASLVMRREVFVRNEKFPICDVEDIPLQLSALSKGYIYYFFREMSLYRYMHEGSWSEEMKKDRKKLMNHGLGMVNFLSEYDKYTDFKFSEILRKREISYLYFGINNNIDMSYDDFESNCKDLFYNTNEVCRNYIKSQCRIFKIIKGEYSFDISECNDIKKYKYVVIMGNGNYAGYLKKVFINSGLEYIGHIVTKLKDIEIDNNRLWDLSSYPYNRKNTLVIVGISQENEYEIMKSLKESGYDNILKPMWFDMT